MGYVEEYVAGYCIVLYCDVVFMEWPPVVEGEVLGCDLSLASFADICLFRRGLQSLSLSLSLPPCSSHYSHIM